MVVLLSANEQQLRRFLTLSDRYITREGDRIIFHNNSMIVNGVVSYHYTPRGIFELNNQGLSGFHNINIATSHIRRHAYVAEIQAIFFCLFFLLEDRYKFAC